MKLNQKIKATVLAGVVAGLFAACSETDYMTYDTAQSGLYFTTDTVRYSFGVVPTSIRSKEVRLPVQIMGQPANYNRTFKFAISAEHTTAENNVQFSLGEPMIEADSISGYIPVIINRDELKGDYVNGYVRYRLDLQLLADDVFTPTLAPKDRVCVLYFDNAVEQPEWLDYKGDKVWTDFMLGKWHPLKYIKMVEYFHQIEFILPESYKKMVESYGENLEHVPYGSFWEYKTIMKKYVFTPMYNYFMDPANREEILRDYADFQFEPDDMNPYEPFPNPTTW